MNDLNARLRRLLFLVPYVAREQRHGVKLEQLGRELGIDRAELLADVDLLTQVGPPGGDPSEYLLVSVEDGRVFVDLPQRLTRPLRLTPAEGCSLLLGLRALRQSGIAPYDQALASAEQKLLRALGADAGAAVELAEETVVAEPDRQVAANLRALINASRERHVVNIAYAAASTGEASQRGLEPYGIVQHNGSWYVVGRCQKRGDVRTFRVDRIVSLEARPEHFDPPADFDLAEYRRERLFIPGADAIQVTVRLDPIAVNRVGAGWPSGEVTRLPDGGAEIVMQCEGLEWVIGWTLGLGMHGEIIAPAAARDAMRVKIETMLDSTSAA